jgi:hypothetical protein
MHTLATRLVLASGAAISDTSQAVSMHGANTAQVSATIYSFSGTNVSFQLQESNDLENWTDKGSPQTKDTVGYHLLPAISSISTAYVRVKYTFAGSGTVILAAIINLSQQ